MLNLMVSGLGIPWNWQHTIAVNLIGTVLIGSFHGCLMVPQMNVIFNMHISISCPGYFSFIIFMSTCSTNLV